MIRNAPSGKEALRVVPRSLNFGTIGPGDTVGLISFPVAPDEIGVPSVQGIAPGPQLRAFCVWVQGGGLFANSGVLIVANNATAGPLFMGPINVEIKIYNREALQ